MRELSAFLFCIFFTLTSTSQIVIDGSDMPAIGDTFRVSITTTIPEDYDHAGPDQVWDFTGLTRMSQRVESFVDVLQTPNLFWFTFIPNVTANLATPADAMNSFPGLPFSDYYTFLKSSSTGFADAGFGFLLSGIPIAMKYNTPDLYYKLPCTMGDEWSSSSSAALSLPGFAYFGTERTRQSVVDAWGTLKTPFGTFQTIRVKSELLEYDSIYLDTLGAGIPVLRTITEYKWLGREQGIPLLQISEEALAKTAVYRDNVGTMAIGDNIRAEARIFPNPASDHCTVDLTGIQFPAVLRITSINGSPVLEKNLRSPASQFMTIDVSGYAAGVYFITIQNLQSVHSEKLIIFN